MRRVLDLARLTLVTSRTKLQPTPSNNHLKQELGFGFSRGIIVPSGINRAAKKEAGPSKGNGSNYKMPTTRAGDSKSSSGSKTKETNKQEPQSHKPSSVKAGPAKPGKIRTTKTTTSSSSSVKHDREKNRFTLDLGNKQEARIDYKSIGHNKVEMYHSEVPKELRGRGIGKALAKGALEKALENNMKVKLTCSYLIDYLEKFADPKLKSIVDNNK